MTIAISLHGSWLLRESPRSVKILRRRQRICESVRMCSRAHSHSRLDTVGTTTILAHGSLDALNMTSHTLEEGSGFPSERYRKNHNPAYTKLIADLAQHLGKEDVKLIVFNCRLPGSLKQSSALDVAIGLLGQTCKVFSDQHSTAG